jgi:hypothetical protein
MNWPIQKFEIITSQGGFRCRDCHTQFYHAVDANNHDCILSRSLSRENLHTPTVPHPPLRQVGSQQSVLINDKERGILER